MPFRFSFFFAFSSPPLYCPFFAFVFQVSFWQPTIINVRLRLKKFLQYSPVDVKSVCVHEIFFFDETDRCRAFVCFPPIGVRKKYLMQNWRKVCGFRIRTLILSAGFASYFLLLSPLFSVLFFLFLFLLFPLFPFLLSPRFPSFFFFFLLHYFTPPFSSFPPFFLFFPAFLSSFHNFVFFSSPAIRCFPGFFSRPLSSFFFSKEFFRPGGGGPWVWEGCGPKPIAPPRANRSCPGYTTISSHPQSVIFAHLLFRIECGGDSRVWEEWYQLTLLLLLPMQPNNSLEGGGSSIKPTFYVSVTRRTGYRGRGRGPGRLYCFYGHLLTTSFLLCPHPPLAPRLSGCPLGLFDLRDKISHASVAYIMHIVTPLQMAILPIKSRAQMVFWRASFRWRADGLFCLGFSLAMTPIPHKPPPPRGPG